MRARGGLTEASGLLDDEEPAHGPPELSGVCDAQRRPADGAPAAHVVRDAGVGPVPSDKDLLVLPLFRERPNQTMVPAQPFRLSPLEECVSPSEQTLLTTNPIPSHAHSRAVSSEEVVSRPRKLAVDDDVAARADEALVAHSKICLPKATIGACLGSAWFLAFDDMCSRIARRRRLQTLYEAVVAPCHHLSHSAALNAT
jgi:hypothetical protein